MSDSPAGGDETPEALRDAYDWLMRRYELPAIVAVIAFMLWVRLQGMSNFVDGEKVYFAGNDAYYHFREVSYVVRNWPFTMPFDPWTYFPFGTSQGQFGTLFDQLIATAALVVGLGSPSEQLVAKTVLVAPTVFGALVAIPTFFVVHRLAGRRAGVTAAVILALIPGTFLQRGLVGFADHNIAEVLFQTTAVLAFMVALATAERDQPVYELVADRDWETLWQPLRYSVAAGVALFLYIWLWPPAIVLVGIIGVFLIIAIPLHVFRGRSPEPLAAVAVVSMGSLTVLELFVLDSLSFSPTDVSLIQVLLSAGVAVGSLYLAWLAREWDARDLDKRGYPAVVGASVIVSIGIVAIVLPSLYEALVANVLRTFAFGQTDTTLTVAESRSVPWSSLGQFLFEQYGLLSLTALAGLLGLLFRAAYSRNYRAETLLVVIWSVAITMMAFSQIRFNYYLAVVVAILTAWVVERILGLIELPSTAKDLEVYQVLTLIIVFFLVFAPLLPPLAAANAVAVGKANGPGEVVTWTQELDWMENNTPPEGQYGGATSELAYHGTFERTTDFEYPTGAYGVMSWWDYGHWITVEAERIPNANPFQQGARPASAFLLAENETRANLILETLPSGPTEPPVYEMRTAELRATVEAQSAQEAGEDTRYVVIDDQMAAGKFSAIATWTGDGPQQYFSQQEFQVAGSKAQLIGPNQAYQNTMLARLYLQDAQGLSHYRLVHETGSSAIVSVAQRTPQGFQQTNIINRRLSQQIYTAVQQRQDLFFYNVRQPAAVKTFERVPGATLTGQVNTTNATTIFVSVPLQTNTGRNFSYVQTVQTDADGNFKLTVPYATDDSVSVSEGGTNSGVVARGNYQLVAGNPFQPSARGNTSVPETAIYDGETISVELEPVEQSSGNETAGNETSNGNESTGNESSNGNESALIFPTGGGFSASLDAPSGLTSLERSQPLAAPRQPADG